MRVRDREGWKLLSGQSEPPHMSFKAVGSGGRSIRTMKAANAIRIATFGSQRL